MIEWIKLEKSVAAKHPKYGIKRLAAFFRFAIIAAPAMWVLTSGGNLASILNARGSFMYADYLTMAGPLILFFWSLWNVHLLGNMDARFIRSFYAYIVVGPVILTVMSLLWMALSGLSFDGQNFAAGMIGTILGWFLWYGVAGLYVLFSVRINVSLLHRVKASDPILSER